MLIALVTAAAAGCPSQDDDGVFVASQAIAFAFVAVDETALAAARARLDRALPCVAAPVDDQTVLAVHVARGLVAFVDGDTVASEASWRAVRRTHPEWALPANIAPEGHPLHGLFDRARSEQGVVVLPRDAPGGWMVDGAAATTAPVDTAVVLQALGVDRDVVWTAYVPSVAALDAGDLLALSALPRVTRRARVVRGWGTVGALALAGASVGLGASADHVASGLASRPYEEVPGGARTVHSLGVGSVVAGAATVAVGAIAWGGRW